MDRLDAYTYAASIYEEIRLLFIELGLTVDITEYINTSRTTYENAINNLTPDKISKGVLLYPLGDFNYKTTQINSIFINYLNALDVAQQAVNYNIGGVRQNIYFQINILAKNYKDAEYIANLIHAKFYRHSGHKTYDLETNQFSTDYFYSVSDFGVEANKIGKADLEHVVEYIIAIGLHQVPIIFSYTQAEIEYGIFQKLNTVLKIDDNNYSLETEYEYNVGDEVTHTDISLNQYFNIVKAGYTYNIEDKPLIWYLGNYYTTFKGNTFEVSGTGDIFAGDAIDYANVTEINVSNQNLTTNFTLEMMRKFVNLTTLDCFINQITQLIVSSNTKLVDLHCADNQLTDLDVSNNKALEELRCFSNLLEELIVSSNIELFDLRCYNNLLTSLNVSTNTKLITLHCFTNQLTELILSSNIELVDLHCSNNLLTDLNISTNTKLVQLRCFNNQLDNLVNSQILIDLDTNGKLNGYLQSSIFGGGALTAAGLAAKASLQSKGWTIVGV